MTTTIALISGANKGIGLETARQLGERGIAVLLGSRDLGRGETAAEELRGQGIDAQAIQLDVTDDASVSAAAAWVEERYGRLDILINNAGIPSAKGKRSVPSGTDLEDMRAVYETNVFGVMRMLEAFVPLVRRSEVGRIVNVSSEMGSITNVLDPASPIAHMPPTVQYTSSKAALNMITRQFAKELRPDGILVNAANPGWTATDFGNGAGVRTPQQGAEPSVYLATLPDDGPTGILYGHLWTTEGDGDGGYGELPW